MARSEPCLNVLEDYLSKLCVRVCVCEGVGPGALLLQIAYVFGKLSNSLQFFMFPSSLKVWRVLESLAFVDEH